MMQPDFVERIWKLAKRYRIEDDELELEFTEEYRSRRAGTDAEGSETAEKAGFICAMDDSERGIRP